MTCLPFCFLSIVQSPSDALVHAQLTVLATGACVVGIALNHSIADGTGVFQFINDWASICQQFSKGIVILFLEFLNIDIFLCLYFSFSSRSCVSFLVVFICARTFKLHSIDLTLYDLTHLFS